MKVKSESEVAQLYPTLSDPMDYSLSGSSIHGIFQARVLEWGAIAFSDMDLNELQNTVTILKFLTNTPKSQWLTTTNIYVPSLLGKLCVGSAWLHVCPHSPWAIIYLEGVLLMASAKEGAKSCYHIKLTVVKLEGLQSSFCLPLIEHSIGNW